MAILNPDGTQAKKNLPKVKAIKPFGSKILVECLKADELVQTSLIIDESTEVGGLPQAYIVELGPNIQAHNGLEVGQRIYWTGNGVGLEDVSENGRVLALLDMHNIQAVIEEETE